MLDAASRRKKQNFHWSSFGKTEQASQLDALAGELRQPPLRTHVGQPDKDRRNT
jgi:hypothetical protein